uniref:pentapeptide repeat-containing protein n=1 Tax=Methanosarcina barkeri TaxID=2208 RepID=UPI00373AEF02
MHAEDIRKYFISYFLVSDLIRRLLFTIKFNSLENSLLSVSLTKSHLQNLVYKKSRLQKVQLTKSYLQKVQFTKSYLQKVQFTKSYLQKVQLTKSSSNHLRSRFECLKSLLLKIIYLI